VSIEINIEFNENMIRSLERIPALLRVDAGDRCLRAMAKPVVERAKQLAPSSRQSGSRKKWSQKLKGDAKWNVDSGRHIAAKVSKLQRGVRVYIGASFPKGNKQQFDASPKGRRMFFWGKDSGRIKQRPNPHFLKKAFDETKSQQIEAFNTQLKAELQEMKLG
jgi:hypothetical protein